MVEKYDKDNLRYVVTPVLGEIKYFVVLSHGKEIRHLKMCKKIRGGVFDEEAIIHSCLFFFISFYNYRNSQEQGMEVLNWVEVLK